MIRTCARDDGPNHRRVSRYVCKIHAPYCDDCLGKCNACRKVIKFCPDCKVVKHCVECESEKTRLCHECEMCGPCLDAYIK